MASTLPILESCNNCGACCLHVRSPPFRVYLDLADGNYRVWNEEDIIELERLNTAPPEAVAALLQGNLDARPSDSPCSWLDVETRQCRYYEHRPQICRDFELGGDQCCEWRKRLGIE